MGAPGRVGRLASLARREGPAEHGCPRCGYDLAGTIAGWAEACEIEGRCAECGLAFAWADIMREDRRDVPGFFEHTRGFWRSLVAAWRTWLWTLRPGSFFRRVRMEHRLRAWKALAWTAVLFGPIQLAHGAAHCVVMCVLISPAFPGALMLTEKPLGLILSRMVRFASAGTLAVNDTTGLAVTIDEWAADVLPLLAMTIAFPAVFLSLPDTRRRANARWEHICRSFSFSLAWLAIPAARTTTQGVLWMLDNAGGVTTGGWPNNLAFEAWCAERWWASLALIALWLSWWWWRAVTRYLRLEQPFRHYLAMLVIALLAGAVSLLLSPSGAWVLREVL